MANTTNLDIFEQESILEEVICAMTVCALYMPNRFDPALIIHPLLAIPNAVTVITMVNIENFLMNMQKSTIWGYLIHDC